MHYQYVHFRRISRRRLTCWTMWPEFILFSVSVVNAVDVSRLEQGTIQRIQWCQARGLSIMDCNIAHGFQSNDVTNSDDSMDEVFPSRRIQSTLDPPDTDDVRPLQVHHSRHPDTDDFRPLRSQPKTFDALVRDFMSFYGGTKFCRTRVDFGRWNTELVILRRKRQQVVIGLPIGKSNSETKMTVTERDLHTEKPLYSHWWKYLESSFIIRYAVTTEMFGLNQPWKMHRESTIHIVSKQWQLELCGFQSWT